MVIDPSRQNWSPYLAMGNDPINNFDPDGRDHIYFKGGKEVGRIQSKGAHRYFNQVANKEYTTGFETIEMAGPPKINAVSIVLGDMLPKQTRNYNDEFAKTQEWLAAKNTPYLLGADGPDAADCAGTICYGIKKVTGKDYGAIYAAGGLMDNITNRLEKNIKINSYG